MTAEQRTRRRFLQMVAASATLPAGLVACSSAGSSPAAFGDISAGNVSSLSVGTLRAISGQPACIGRDANGVYAMTLTCTHQGCDMGSRGSVSSAGITCNCHGSRFDANGGVTSGPASDPLQHFAVSVGSSGDLTVHGGTPVGASTRLAV